VIAVKNILFNWGQLAYRKAVRGIVSIRKEKGDLMVAFLSCTEGGTRTRTSSQTLDFESNASTNSATSAREFWSDKGIKKIMNKKIRADVFKFKEKPTMNHRPKCKSQAFINKGKQQCLCSSCDYQYLLHGGYLATSLIMRCALMVMLFTISFIQCGTQRKENATSDGKLSIEHINKVVIKSVSYDIESVVPIMCNEFEEEFQDRISTIEITNSLKLQEFSEAVSHVKFNSQKIQNTRVKVIIFYDKHIDTLCMSDFTMRLNGKSIESDPNIRKFIDSTTAKN
jgi:transposase-like protein